MHDGQHTSSKNQSLQVILKVVPVVLYSQDKELQTYAILDDGSERSIILPAAAKCLGLNGNPKVLSIQTIQQDVLQVKGATVTFQISPVGDLSAKYVRNAFTANELSLMEHSCPVTALQLRYPHLKGLSLPQPNKVQPLVLIGSDHPHLVIPTEPVHTGPPGAPYGVCTALGWAMQGPSGLNLPTTQGQQFYFAATRSSTATS